MSPDATCCPRGTSACCCLCTCPSASSAGCSAAPARYSSCTRCGRSPRRPPRLCTAPASLSPPTRRPRAPQRTLPRRPASAPSSESWTRCPPRVCCKRRRCTSSRVCRAPAASSRCCSTRPFTPSPTPRCGTPRTASSMRCSRRWSWRRRRPASAAPSPAECACAPRCAPPTLRPRSRWAPTPPCCWARRSRSGSRRSTSGCRRSSRARRRWMPPPP